MGGVSQELSNEVSFWVLTALSEESKHGYAILRDVELLSTSQGSPVTLKVPTLYGALDRLNLSCRALCDAGPIIREHIGDR